MLVFACASDKNPDDFAQIFLDKIACLYLTIPGSVKKSDFKKVMHAFTQVFAAEKAVPIEASEDFNFILKRAFYKSRTENRPLLITGSFYLAAEAQRIYSAGDF